MLFGLCSDESDEPNSPTTNDNMAKAANAVPSARDEYNMKSETQSDGGRPIISEVMEGESLSADAVDRDEPAKAPEAPMCMVCQENIGKYKCPRCEQKYCSVACNKIHKPTHDGEPEPPTPTFKPMPDPIEEDEAKDKIGLFGRKLGHPYKTLEHSEEWKWLLDKFPRLPILLLKIDNSRQPPPSVQDKIPAAYRKQLKQGSNDNWSKEMGIQKGKTTLRKLLQDDGEDGEAVREYCTLVRALLDDAYDR